MKTLSTSLLIGLAFWLINPSTTIYAQTALAFSSIDNPANIELEQEILHQAYQRLGIEISILPMPAKRALRSANSGMTDGEAARVAAIEQEYPNLIRIDVPIRIIPMYLYVKAGQEFTVNGWEGIPDDYILGIRRGIKFAEYAVAEHKLKSITNSSEKILFEQLSKGRIDIALSNQTLGEQLIEEFQLKDVVRLEPPIYTSHLYHFLHKKHAHLVPKITRTLQEMAESGIIQNINKQILKSREELEQ